MYNCDAMRISVNNFGPIREANIRISPLTLFVGPSNTGKSYLATLLYAAIAPSNLHTVAVHYQKTKPINADLVKKCFMRWAEFMGNEWQKNIVHCLGEAGEDILKSQNMSVELSSSDDDMTPDDGDITIDLRNPKNSRIGNGIINSIIDNLEKRGLPKSGLERSIGLSMFTEIEFMHKLGRYGRIYYLPAVRGGIMKSYRIVADRAILNAAKASTSPMFSGIYGNCARQLISIKKTETDVEDALTINKVLEDKVLDGRINVTFSDTESPEFRYEMNDPKGKKGDMAINNVSDAVAGNAVLSVFMRYHLRSITGGSNFWILEEPEINLHPEKQRNIVDILVRLANAGEGVLATTHSDVVLGQIGNAYRASQLKDAEKGKRLLGEEREPLRKDKALAVYSFIESPKGTKVEKIDFGHITGVMTEDHLDAARSLYNQTVRMVNSKNNE